MANKSLLTLKKSAQIFLSLMSCL